MTQEEKAKAYDEAIEKAKQTLEASSAPEAKMIVYHFFPELRESEDEKIRESLIKFLTDIKRISESGRTTWAVRKEDAEMCKSSIAWLEKQKEREPLTKDEEYTLHRIIEYLEDETCPPEWISLLHDIYCLPYPKQKEQKPLPGFENADEGIPGKDFIPVEWVDACDRYGKWKIVRCDEQKPVELTSTDAIEACMLRYLQSAANRKDDDEIMEDTRKYKQELIGLIWQFSNPPKQEWSEEDKKTIRDAIDILNYEGYKTNAEALKSLRPSWKPSEEQMNGFHTILYQPQYISNSDDERLKQAESLYKDLKKLI